MDAEESVLETTANHAFQSLLKGGGRTSRFSQRYEARRRKEVILLALGSITDDGKRKISMNAADEWMRD